MTDQRKRGPESPEQQPELPVTASDALLARLNSLLDAFWPSAMGGDVKAGELVRRILGQQADVLGLRGKTPPVVEQDDELAKLRARRAAT